MSTSSTFNCFIADSHPGKPVNPGKPPVCPPTPSGNKDLSNYMSRFNSILQDLYKTYDKNNAKQRIEILIAEMKTIYPNLL